MDKRVIGLIAFIVLLVVGMVVYSRVTNGSTEEPVIKETIVEQAVEEPNVVGRVQKLEQEQIHTLELMQKIIDMNNIEFPYCSFDDLCQSEKILYECNLNNGGLGCDSVISLP